MKIIRPVGINDTTFTSSNVHEVAPAVWSGATTYGLGDFAHIVDGQVLKIYESLQAGNLNKAPATETAWWVYRSSTYAVYNPATAYSIDDIVIVAADHKAYRSLQNANTGNTPSTNLTGETPYWQDYGATEPWKSFDSKVGSQTTRTGKIDFSFTPGVVITGIAFLNLSGVTVEIVMTDPIEGVVYNETVNLYVVGDGSDIITDWFEYFFGGFSQSENLVKTDLPPYSSAVISVSIEAETTTTLARCGQVVIGGVQSLGGTQYGLDLSIADYSTKETDVFGNHIIVQRPYSDKMGADVVIENRRLGFVKRLLTSHRTEALVWVAAEETVMETATIVYGYYRDFSLVVSYPNHSLCSITIEGLT